MTIEEAIELVDERMCFGRGKWSEHHQPEIDIYWEAGSMAISALKEKKKWMDAAATTQGFDPEHLTPQDKQDIMDALKYLKERLEEDGRNDKNDP